MPELPEVETLRCDLRPRFVGHRLERAEVTGPRTVRRHPPELLAQLHGDVLAEVGRHGKYLLFQWASGRALVAHLRMSGQLLASEPGTPLARHTHAVLWFGGAGQLRFVDPRTFGELFMASSPGPQVAEIAHLGPDALAAGAGYLVAELARRRAPLKSVLVDQRVLAGIGNIYADEICFDARLRPDRPAAALRPVHVQRLAASVRRVLAAAVQARGSTLADGQYVDLNGQAGRYQGAHMVYGRAGQPCRRCGREVARLAWGARQAYACTHCQH